MKKLRVGLIGAGFIGALHARIYSENPMAELVAISDVNEEAGRKLADELGADFYTDYHELLGREDIDAVDICVPEDYHVQLAVAAAAAKKDIFLEKPIAKTKQEAEQIKQAAQENGVRLMIGHVLKFDPRYVQLKDAISSGRLGEITTLALKRTNSHGTPKRLLGKISFFYYMGIHDIEWMLDYNKPHKPVKVYAQASEIVNKGLDLDATFVTITFENGSIGSLELHWAFPQNGAVGFMTSAEVVGSKGASLLHVDDQGLLIATDSGEIEYPDALHWPEYNGRIMGDLREEIDHYILATLKGEPYLVDTDNAILAVEVVEAAMQSIKTGMPIEMK